MNINGIYRSILKASIENNNSEIFSIYENIVKEHILDREIIIRLMNHMYILKHEECYMNLLKLFCNVSKNDSELAYFIGFYFLIKNSPYHSYLSFKMVKSEDAPFYHHLSKSNIEFLKKSNAKITCMLKKSLEEAIENEPHNISLIEQLNNLNDIEAKMTATVIQIIDVVKKGDKKII